jgi:hypothetical protein
LATKVFCCRKEEELQAQRLKQRGKAEALVVAMRENNLGQRGEHERDPVCYCYNKPGCFRRDCLEGPYRPCPIC